MERVQSIEFDRSIVRLLGVSRMPEDQLTSLAELKSYVQNKLSEDHQLLPGAFPVTERLLVRGGRPCGLSFCLHGPRSVKLTAIWEAARNLVLFYDESGTRYQTRTVGSARLPQLLAA
jgi:hypothetical protein